MSPDENTFSEWKKERERERMVREETEEKKTNGMSRA